MQEKHTLKITKTDHIGEVSEILLIFNGKKLGKVKLGLGDSKTFILNSHQHDPKTVLAVEDTLDQRP